MQTKRFIFSLFLIIISVAVQAQYQNQAGNWAIGGELNFKTISEKDSDISTPASISLGISPSLRYFFTNNWAGEIAVGYTFNRQFSERVGSTDLFDKTHQLLVTPRLYYYYQLGEKFYYNPSAFIGIGGGKITYELDSDDNKKMNLFNMGIGLRLLSFEFRPTPTIALGFSCGVLSYNFNSNKIDDIRYKNHRFDLTANVAPTLSFSYYFKK